MKAENLATPTPSTHRMPQRRAAGAVLMAGSLIYFLAEFIAAAAWTDPPYSYTYDYISNLGVRGPSEAFGQVMNSPLAWVMNAGFFAFGVTLFAGAVMLKGLAGWRRWAVLIPAGLLAIGGVVLALFPGSGDTNGSVDYHSLGALAGFVGGNVLAIALGRLYRNVGITRRTGTALTALGVFGLVSLVGFLSIAGSPDIGVIGLVERCVVYPFLFGLIGVGVSAWCRGALDVPRRRRQ